MLERDWRVVWPCRIKSSRTDTVPSDATRKVGFVETRLIASVPAPRTVPHTENELPTVRSWDTVRFVCTRCSPCGFTLVLRYLSKEKASVSAQSSVSVPITRVLG